MNRTVRFSLPFPSKLCICLLVCVGVFFSSQDRNLLAQSSVKQSWITYYAGPDSSDNAVGVVTDLCGNIYVAIGSFNSYTRTDYVIVKYSSVGVKQWEASFAGPGSSDDFPTAIVVDDSGNVYITGKSEAFNTRYDYVTIKYNPSGLRQWIASYDGPGHYIDEPRSIAVDKYGNVYVTGQSSTTNTFPIDYDYATVKYNANGIQHWVSRYAGPVGGVDGAYAIVVSGSGEVYVTGASTSSSIYPFDYDYATIKYSGLGVQRWVAVYESQDSSGDFGKALAVDGKGNVYVTGSSILLATSNDYLTVKYDSVGSQVWAARYDGPTHGSDVPRALKIDGLGNVHITGTSDGQASDFATIKYSPDGAQQWVARYDGPAHFVEWAFDLEIDGVGNAYVTGASFGEDDNEDYATVKYNSSGSQQWAVRYRLNSDTRDWAFDLALDSSANVYVTGILENVVTGNVITSTIKYVQSPTAVEEIHSLPPLPSLLENYPNPFNGTTIIRYTLPKKENCRVTIANILGQEVVILVDANQEAGEHQVEWSPDKVASGMYFCLFKTDYGLQVRKLILIR